MKDIILPILRAARKSLAAGPADNWESALYDRLQPYLRAQERREEADRRESVVQAMDLESGKTVWYVEAREISGFERRTGLDRRRDPT
ncbi:MAG: hypothetical protein IH870_07420 [Chloroflexi bacterium]|nr:hypothetical protein [Chloroflexota bacterium]